MGALDWRTPSEPSMGRLRICLQQEACDSQPVLADVRTGCGCCQPLSSPDALPPRQGIRISLCCVSSQVPLVDS